MKDLTRLKQLRSFLVQEAAIKHAVEFRELNGLKYDQHGRAPTADEWAKVEFLTQVLFAELTEPLRRKFTLGETPGWIATLPIFLGMAALFALAFAVGVWGSPAVHAWALPCYLTWLIALGAVGAIAFIGMNALSVQQDVTFDLTNDKLIKLRMVLGALFGVVLTVPFGYYDFLQFVQNIAEGTNRVDAPGGAGSMKRAMLLLLPFVLGFSTSLVIMILNRLVDGIQAFFGRPTSPPVVTPLVATMSVAPATAQLGGTHPSESPRTSG